MMAFHSSYISRTMITIDNQSIEQVPHFNYLGCDVHYVRDNDISNKLHKFYTHTHKWDNSEY